MLRSEASKRDRGFTLVELLLVVTILAIVASLLVIPRFTRGSESEARAASTYIASRLRDARAAAIIQQASKTVVFDLDGRFVWVDDGGPMLQLPAALDVRITSAFRSGARAGTSQIEFYPDGSSSGGTILLSRGSRATEIRVNWLTGRVTHATSTSHQNGS